MIENIVIVDYQLGNIYSVQQAFHQLGVRPIMSANHKDIREADALVLPGVGAFGDAMDKMHELNLVESIRDFSTTGKPIMGICLGMQLLFERSIEFGEHAGLGLIEGEIHRFKNQDSEGNRIKVPHTSWEKIKKNPESQYDWEQSALQGLNEEDYFYFVHSFYALPTNTSNILSYTSYGDIEFCSTVKLDNIFATQYHPEKSGVKGLKIYENWINNN